MLEPTPSLFYDIISEAFGKHATFASRSIRKIQLTDNDKTCPTLQVGKEQVIFVNTNFWRKHVSRKVDAKILFLHELFHVVTGDINLLGKLQGMDAQLANLSMDMRINAAIAQHFIGQQNVPTVLERMYKPNGIMGLLRPLSAYGVNSKYRLIYSALYSDGFRKTKNMPEMPEAKLKELFKSEETIRNALKILIPKQEQSSLKGIVYIGNHGNGDNKEDDKEDEKEEKLDIGEVEESLKEEIGNAIKNCLKEKGAKGGFGQLLIDNMIDIIDSSRSINLKALDRFACNHKVNEMKAWFQKERRATNVVPIKPSARDMSMVANGIIPSLWHNRVNVKHNNNKNIAFYLDVSGSTTSMLPTLLGFIKNLHKEIKTIYCFSNEVHEHSMQELSEGKYKTTGGTDFDCVAKHILSKPEIDKVVILTDGYADIRKTDVPVLKQQLVDAAVIYFGDSVNKENFFAKEYGKGYDLEDLM